MLWVLSTPGIAHCWCGTSHKVTLVWRLMLYQCLAWRGGMITTLDIDGFELVTATLLIILLLRCVCVCVCVRACVCVCVCARGCVCAHGYAYTFVHSFVFTISAIGLCYQ